MKPKPLKPGMTEAQVLAGTLEALALYGLRPERRNVGGFVNAKGQYVPCNAKGTPDIDVILPRHFAPQLAGKLLRIETKREGWRPERARGAERARFESQLAYLKRINNDGGFGIWIDSPECVVHVLERIKLGWRVVLLDGYPFLFSGDEREPQD